MSYFICSECKTAAEKWNVLYGHMRGAHKDIGTISKENIETVEELEEGYRLLESKAKRKKEEKETPEEMIKEVRVPKELPTEFTERVKLSLDVHEFPERLKNQITNVLWLHPETHDNPNNFANLLAHICSTYPGGMSHSRKIPLLVSEVFGQQTAEIPYMAGHGTQQSGYYDWQQQAYGGAYQPGTQSRQPQYDDPISRWINYQMYKESKKEEEEKPKEKESKISPAIQAELDEIKTSYQSTTKFMQELLEKIEKQDKKDEESKLEGRFARLEDKIEGKKSDEGKTDWLQIYLSEREKREEEARKRLEDIIKAQGDKLAEATKEVVKAREKADRSAAEAITQEEARVKRYEDRLKESGWSPRKKEGEEAMTEMITSTLAPGLISEVKETGRALRSLTGAIQQKPAVSQEIPLPTSPEEAEKIAEIMTQREQIRKLQEQG